MFGLPDYKIAVQHGDEKIYFGDVALVNPFTDGDVDEYDWLDAPSMIEFVLTDLLPEHPDYELVPYLSAHSAVALAIKSEADRLRALQVEANRGDAGAIAALKSLKEGLLFIASAGKGFKPHSDSIGKTPEEGIVLIRSRA